MKKITTLLLMLTCFYAAFGQGWERFYGAPSDFEEFHDVIQAPDGGYYALIEKFSGSYIILAKIDQQGVIEWEQPLGPFIGFANAQILPHPSGNLALYLGTSPPRLMLVNPGNNVIWEKSYNNASANAYDIMLSLNDGYVKPWMTGDSLLNVIKIDFDGQVLWSKTHDIPHVSIVNGYAADYNGNGFVMASTLASDFYIIKFDSNGDLEWEKTDGSPTHGEWGNTQVTATNDGGFAVATDIVSPDSQFGIAKFSPNGDLSWYKVFDPDGPNNGTYLRCIIQTSDNGYMVSGGFNEPGPFNPLSCMMKLEANGDLVFHKTYAANIQEGWFEEVIETSDGGYLAVGYSRQIVNGLEDGHMVKVDSNGTLYHQSIEGNVVKDEDLDCIIDASENPLSSWIVKLFNGTFNSYSTTDADGFYHFEVDTGSYEIEIIHNGPYWVECVNPVTVALSNLNDTMTVDFPIQLEYECPLMTIDILPVTFNPCTPALICIQYCNQGTIPADSASISLVLDDQLGFTSSNFPATVVSDSLVTFDLGSVGVNQCSTLLVWTMVDCDANLGELLCVEAQIFPDTFCIPPSPWSGAIMQASATCVGDTVVSLTVENIGSAPTTTPIEYIVIEDQIIFLQMEEVFDVGEAKHWEFPADGTFWRIESEQEPGYPFAPMPNGFVEGCGGQGGGVAFANQYPIGDGGPFTDLVCGEVTGPYDPNDKAGFPNGYGEQHHIEPNTDIEYRIRFQNTGTDTAFNVVLLDTLSSHLDPASIRPGASSHAYEFDLYGSGIVKFRFPDIMLPDSNVNEPLSHGFVSFRISQRPGLPLPTVIENSAAIYFDFNEPIITNTTFHTVDTNFIEVVSDVSDLAESLGELLVFPNPSDGDVLFELASNAPAKAVFTLHDTFGRALRSDDFDGKQYRFQREGLADGVYFYRVEVEGKGWYTGKVILK